jgi:DNA invertase Pin-like site-specific DNA recombinase
MECSVPRPNTRSRQCIPTTSRSGNNLVWKLDRFGRSLRHLVNMLAELEILGVDFASLRDNLDLTTPSRRLMFQIIGAMAEYEQR